MRNLAALMALAAASLACGPVSAQTPSDANPYWAGCVIARQFTANGATIAIDRVCSVPNRTFSVFEPTQMGARPQSAGALRMANLRFTAFRSRYAQGDSRQARLWLDESGAGGQRARYTYDVELTVDQEAIVTMPSGVSIGLRMDPANVPTPFAAVHAMPTWQR